LIVLAYLGPIAIRIRPRWGAFRAAAEAERVTADAEAKLASDAAGQAERLRQEGRASEAEQFAKEVEGHRQKESLHRQNLQEFLSRWW
jgi:hypothetical protein